MAKFVLTAQIALQAPRNVGQVVNQIRRQLQGINVNINVNANTRTLNNVNNQLNTTAKSARVAQNSISELGKSLGIAARRFGAIAIATGTFLSLSRAIKSSLGDAIEFERQLVNLSQVTGKSVKNLQDITNEITRLSTGLGVSSDQLLKTSIILAQAGLEASKTKAALEVLAKTELASSFDNITNTTEGAIAILSQFRREAAAAGGDVIYLERALGAINDVSKKFAVESADLVAVIRRSGGAFEAAGGSLNELLALFTSVRATTRESAETIATGLRTIFTRIQRVDTIRQLQELGIALQDAEGKFVGPFEAIKRISEGLSGLDPRDFRFAAIVEELGGFRQIGKVIPLIKQFALAQDALNTAQGASSSLTKDAEIAQLSLANQLAKVREEFQALIRRFVDSSSFQTVARGALEFARALIRIADAISPLIPLIASLAAIQIGKGFIPALGALTGVTRRNQGGKIHAFASGGFVPGTGNRDTVPAMLTPGEFVIRKGSAKKIGAERLQRLNEGGPVKVSELLGERSGAATIKKALYNKKLKPSSNLEPNDTVIATIKQSEIRLDKDDFESIWDKAQTSANDAVKRGDKKAKPRDYSKLRLTEEIMREADASIGNQGKGLSRSEDVSLYMSAENRWGKAYEEVIKDKANKEIMKGEKEWQLAKGTSYPVDLIKDGDEFAAGEAKFKSRKTEENDLISKLLRRRIDKGQLSGFIENSKDKIDSNINLGTLDYFFAGDQKTSFLEWVRKNKIQEANRGGIIQKFAGGGIVDVLTGQESVAALMMTDASPGQTRIPIKYPDDLKSALESRKQGSESITRGNKLLNSIKLDQYGLNKSAGSDFAARLRENLTNGAASAVNQTVGQMAPTFSGLGIRADFKNLIPGEKVKSAISGGVIGTLFESIIDNLSNQSKDVKDSSFFDFVGPLSDNATKLFEKSESVNNSTYKDAKIQIKAKNIESKIINQASQELGLGTNVQSTGQIQTAQDYIDKLTRAGLYEKFKTTGVSFAKLSEAGIKGVNKDATLAMLQDKFGVDRIGYRDYQLNQKDPTTGQPRIGRDFFLKYAMGGMVAGQKQPMLTQQKTSGIELIKLAKQRASFLSSSLNVKPEDIMSSVSLDTNLQASAAAARGKMSGSKIILNPNRLFLHDEANKKRTIRIIDHELAHSIDNLFARRQGHQEQLSTVVGKEGTIFKGMAQAYFNDGNKFKTWLKTTNLKSYITNTKHLQALEKLKAANQLDTLTSSQLNNILQANPKVLNEGFPLAFQNLSDQSKQALLSSIGSQYSKTGKTPSLEAVKQEFQAKMSGAKPKKPTVIGRIKDYASKLFRFAKGGAASDTVPALLTPGEFVVNKKTAQEVGYGALNRMNKTGDIQGFAKGGLVGIQRFAQGGGPVTPGPLNVSSQGPPSLNMAVLASTFDQLVQQGGGMVTSFNLLKSAVEEMQAAGVKFTAAEKAAIKQMADDARKKAAAEKTQIDSYTKLQKSQQEAKDKFANFKSGIEKTLGSMQQFVFLGTTVLALATQFSSLDEATNSAITETLAMGASIIAVVGTVGDLILSTGLADTALKYFTASVTRAGTAAAASSATGAAGKAGGGAAASAGLLGRLIPLIANPVGAVIAIVVAALAGFAAYIYFIQARARKVAEGLRKSADTIAENIEKGKGGSTQEFVDLQVKAAQTVTDSYLTFVGLLDAAGMTSAKARQEEVNAVKRSAEAYIGVVQSISDVNKSIANIDLDKTLKPAEAAFKKIAAIDTGVRSQTGVLSGPSSQFQEIAKLAEREGIRKPISQITEADFSSDTAKAQFKLANDAITKVTEDFEKRIPESISLLQTQLEDSLQSVNFGQAAKIDLNNDNIIDSFDTVLQQNQAFANSVNTVIKLIQIEAQARADAARQAGKFVEAGNIEADAQERVKVVQEAIQKQAVAFAKSQESALAFQAALEASTAQFKGLSATTQFISKLGDQAKEFGNRISTLGDIMSGEMPTFEVDQIQGLGNLSEIQDLDKFTQEVGKLGASIGPKGKELAGNLIQSADLMENAKRELTGINFAEIGGGEESAAKTAFKKAFGDQLDTIFGPQVGGKLRTVMEKRLEDAIRTASEGGGMVDPAELENILDPLKQMTEETRKMFEAYNNAQIEFVNQYNNTSKMLLEVMQRDIDGRQKIVDIQNRGLERMDQATGRTPGFQEKEARRNASRGSRLGALGLGALTGDIRGMGNALRNTNQNLEANSQKIKQDPGNEVLGRSQRLLTLQANELKKALEDLTDQSDKASDIMGEIDKERAKRDTLTKIVEDFVVGNNEERMSTVRQFQGIEFAAATGSLQGLQPEDRKATFGLLSQLADVDDGFKQLKENLVMRDAIAMGLPPELARALATKTPKEEQLLVELSNLTAQEIAAQQELNRINAEFGGKLSTEINNLSQKIENLGSVIESKLNAEVAKAKQEQGADKALVAAEKAKQEALAGPQQKLSQIKTNRENKEKEIQQKEIELKGAREAAAAGVQQVDKAKSRSRTWTDAAIENAPMAFGPAGIAYSAMGGPSPITSYRQKEISGYKQNITNQQTIASQREAELNALRQEQQKLLLEEQLAQEKLKKAKGKARGGLVYRASGGSIFKPKGTDTVPAMLTPGEFVMRKAAVDKYGADTMEAMNSGSAPGMNRGGIVRYLNAGSLVRNDTRPFLEQQQKEEQKRKESNLIRGQVLNDDPESRKKFENLNMTRGERDLTGPIPPQSDKNFDLEQQNADLGFHRTRGMELKGKAQRKKYMDIAQYNAETQQQKDFFNNQNPNLVKSFELTNKRREAEKEKRKVLAGGQSESMVKRRSAIQERLQERQFNIQSSRFNRKQEALPSYMRSETPRHLQTIHQFKAAQESRMAATGVGQGMGMGVQAQAMQPQMRGPMMGAQAMNGGMAQGQGFNMEPLMQLKQTFDNLAGVLNNMQMTHQVNVDGALNINGVDAPQVAEAIKQYLGNFIVTEVNKIINNQDKSFKGQT